MFWQISRHPIVSRCAGILLLLLLTLSAVASVVADASHDTSMTIVPERAETTTFLYMKEVTSLREDGSGEELAEWNIRNDGFFSISEATVWINTPTAAYSNVRTWDDNGSLDHTLVINEGRIEITIHFRHPVAPGSSYHYFLAIDLDNIANFDGAEWNFSWQTSFPVQQFVRGISLPTGANISEVTPLPDTQNGTYLEWTRSNITVFNVSLRYILRSLTDAELVERYAPYFRLHPGDPYVPMSVDLALLHAMEIKDHSTGETAQDVTTGHLESDEWHEATNAYINFYGNPLLDATNGSEDYYRDNVKQDADAAPTVYARVYRNQTPNPTRIVLQYWLYYFYNSWLFAGGLNLHEGDWEMVQIVLDGNGIPLYAAYAQHAPLDLFFYDLKGGSKKEWNDLHRHDTHPIVFPGYGSHASYFSPHSYLATRDKTGSETEPLIIPTVELLPPDTQNSWVSFAGRWGEKVDLSHFSGPNSPAKQGAKWLNPLHWSESSGPETIPWDEDSDHHMGKFRVSKDAPCNIGVLDLFTARRFGWFFSTFYSEIDGGEYVVNETSSKRSVILHDSFGQNHFRYSIAATCEQFITPSLTGLTAGNAVEMRVQFVDEVTGEIVTLTYELSQDWQPEHSIAYVELQDGTDFAMETDIDGDDVIDMVTYPVVEEAVPIEEPTLRSTGFYLPFLTWK